MVRPPKQQLATFGVTNLRYFMVTEPVYQEITGGDAEAVLREGKLISRQPEVVTPSYLMNVQGFGDEAQRMFRMLASQLGPSSPGLMYSYRNESEKMDILSGDPDGVAERVKDDLDRKQESLAVVLRGPDELWDVALLKFIFEYTAASAPGNVGELEERGMLQPDPRFGPPPRRRGEHRDDVPPPGDTARRRPARAQGRTRPVGGLRPIRRPLPCPLSPPVLLRRRRASAARPRRGEGCGVPAH